MSRYVIEKDLLIENINTIKSKANVPLIAVVKGNGYGFGIKELTKILKENDFDTFAVTEVDDIADLKDALDDEDILVMRSTCIESEAAIIAKNSCIATIGSLESARVMNDASAKLGVNTRCHLKIDTGLGRYGFMPSQIEDAIKCYDMPNLEFTGIYTHFSSAFSNCELTNAQLAVFNDTVEQIRKAGINPGVVHASNSPALFNFDICLDSARIGSAFTGRLVTSKKTGLNRLGRLEAEVIEIKTVPSGYSVGYNGLFTAKRETKLAIVPIGHYDGFGLTKEKEEADFRCVLSQLKKFLKKQRLTVEINGKSYAVAGEIGLSHTAVDITDSDVKIGDIASVDISPLMVNPKIKRIYK